MLPTLPQHAADPTRRQHGLAESRSKYQFDYSYKELANALSVPLEDKSNPRYWAGLGAKSVELFTNKALWRGRENVSDAADGLKQIFDKPSHESFAALRKAVAAHSSSSAKETRPDRLEDYERMFVTLRKPPVAASWQSDRDFAWQALAGYNPTMLTRMTERWAHFPVTDALYQRAIGSHDSFERALAEGRLYVSDYKRFEGIPGGVVDGLQKFLTAPIALYSWQPPRAGTPGMLLPVAIQVGQSPSSPLFTPQDAISWRMARTAVMVAESQQGGLIVHFGLCHLVLESVVLSARRQLASDHPIRVLLEPHFECTLIANEITKSTLVNPGGIIDRLQAPPLDTSLDTCLSAIAEFHLSESSPPEDFARRGVDSLEALPDYPFRDDSSLIWAEMLNWVDGYVRLYYQSDADVALDTEMAAFVTEMGARDGGRLKGLTIPKTVEEVVSLTARIVFRASAYHASINYSLYDFCFAPSGPTAGYGRGPTGGHNDTMEALRQMIPPEELAYESVDIYWSLTFKLNRLGDYPAFSDAAVAPLLSGLQAQLRAADETIRHRDASRPISYLYYAPSEATQSIHV